MTNLRRVAGAGLVSLLTSVGCAPNEGDSGLAGAWNFGTSGSGSGSSSGAKMYLTDVRCKYSIETTGGSLSVGISSDDFDDGNPYLDSYKPGAGKLIVSRDTVQGIERTYDGDGWEEVFESVDLTIFNLDSDSALYRDLEGGVCTNLGDMSAVDFLNQEVEDGRLLGAEVTQLGVSGPTAYSVHPEAWTGRDDCKSGLGGENGANNLPGCDFEYRY